LFVTFRAATLADLDSVRSLLEASKLPLDGVSDCIDDFIVAEEQGKIVGSIAVERYGHYGLLRSAAVNDSERGKGLGAGLVASIIEKAKSDGIDELFLLTTTAENYFPRFGFNRMTREDVPDALNASAELRGACPDSAIVMRRKV
jgi:amino-acid N-acetyltransferase